MLGTLLDITVIHKQGVWKGHKIVSGYYNMKVRVGQNQLIMEKGTGKVLTELV